MSSESQTIIKTICIVIAWSFEQIQRTNIHRPYCLWLSIIDWSNGRLTWIKYFFWVPRRNAEWWCLVSGRDRNRYKLWGFVRFQKEKSVNKKWCMLVCVVFSFRMRKALDASLMNGQRWIWVKPRKYWGYKSNTPSPERKPEYRRRKDKEKYRREANHTKRTCSTFKKQSRMNTNPKEK